jgi:hypothetical protein
MPLWHVQRHLYVFIEMEKSDGLHMHYEEVVLEELLVGKDLSTVLEHFTCGSDLLNQNSDEKCCSALILFQTQTKECVCARACTCVRVEKKLSPPPPPVNESKLFYCPLKNTHILKRSSLQI